MSIIVRIPTHSGLQDPDRMIQNIQQKIAANVSWLEYVFGSAEIINRNNQVFPGVFISNLADPENVMPNDNWKSYAFFLKGKEILTREKSVDAPFVAPTHSIDLSLIVCCWVNRINRSASYFVESSNLRQDIMNTLENKLIGVGHGTFLVSSITDRPEDVFKEFTLSAVKIDFYSYPFKCWRFDGVLEYGSDCYTVTT